MKKALLWGPEQSILTSVIVVDFPHHPGPPVHAIPPGVFDRTGGDLPLNGAQFGLRFGILWERGPLRARIGEVVKSEKMVVSMLWTVRITGGSFDLMGCL
jgi:hypothetical protein